MKRKTFNFSPGPACLPEEVLEIVQAGLFDYRGSGIGLMELSHRSALFEEIIKGAESDLRELLGLTADYAIVFLGGGATLQFAMVPMNLLGADQQANFILSGWWAEKAYEEAQKFGAVHVAASSADDHYSCIPEGLELSARPAYLHFTSNNTIFGTEFKTEPDAGGIPLVCDASSDILSRPIDVGKYGLIYAGAQKNLGPAGVTLVIIRKDLLARSPKNLPILLDYNLHVAHGSLYNTPPAFAIYVVREVLQWIKRQGGLNAIGERNQRKAAKIYAAIDASDFYRGTARKDSRSLMNVTFRLVKPELEPVMLKEAAAHGLVQLKGHRLTGGLRASIYNAFPEEGVDALVGFMGDFAARNG
jgi:phosphoserine aminotransferase